MGRLDPFSTQSVYFPMLLDRIFDRTADSQPDLVQQIPSLTLKRENCARASLMNKKKRELEQNELADAIGSKLDQIRPHIPKIAMFAVVGVLAIIAAAFWVNTRQSVSESQWREYFVSSRFADSRGMKTVAEIFPDTTVGNLAMIYAGDSDFASGSNTIVSNRQAYTSQLKQAAENYERVIESSKVDEFAKVRATYALGYTYESLGRFDDAREMYQAVAEGHPDTPEGELAAKSLTRINDANLTSIFAAFKEWAPKPDETAPGELGIDSSLPQRPDISMPSEMEQAPDFDPESDGESGEPPVAGDEPGDESADVETENDSDSSDEKEGDGDGQAD